MGALFLSALLALNAITPLHSMVSRIARLRAWQVGASRAASVARRPPRTHLALAPDSHQQQRTPAMERMAQLQCKHSSGNLTIFFCLTVRPACFHSFQTYSIVCTQGE